MPRRPLALLLAVLVVSGCHGPSITGSWTPVEAHLGGKDFPIAAFGGASPQLTRDTYEFAGDRGAYEVLSKAGPTAIDIHGVAGPNAGRTTPPSSHGREKS